MHDGEELSTGTGRVSSPGGPWTSHGHAIEGVTVGGSGRPPVARCGGPALCKVCAVEAERIRAEDERSKSVRDPRSKAMRDVVIDEMQKRAVRDERFRSVVEPLGFFTFMELVDGLVDGLLAGFDATEVPDV